MKSIGEDASDKQFGLRIGILCYVFSDQFDVQHIQPTYFHQLFVYGFLLLLLWAHMAKRIQICG